MSLEDLWFKSTNDIVRGRTWLISTPGSDPVWPWHYVLRAFFIALSTPTSHFHSTLQTFWHWHFTLQCIFDLINLLSAWHGISHPYLFRNQPWRFVKSEKRNYWKNRCSAHIYSALWAPDKFLKPFHAPAPLEPSYCTGKSDVFDGYIHWIKDSHRGEGDQSRRWGGPRGGITFIYFSSMIASREI